ncbi:hydroxyisourate hydrolase [Aquibacillus koreensis]|uniref:5-hydroxyisourate hydrolase n=1 Tax=Aquibacillus koreensis TaxID=279446 RepID=A0A9X3WK56_9BACI|nr:hydroxyisourate hydrolase [Aquibacillus koreensis]MCT2537777.1 hydroxyisourate hydrolase [Aquibacillus koreensis]MDC3421190.1 hydroxyisourate hydrolase [Aquibacillus koreensis]
MAGLTTHILDLTYGQPASNVTIDLYRVEEDKGMTFIKSATTNKDGRLDHALLEAEELEHAIYQLVFHIGPYFRGRGVEIEDPLFLDQVPVQFGVNDPTTHYHVPLLVSPWGYQVYRGS